MVIWEGLRLNHAGLTCCACVCMRVCGYSAVVAIVGYWTTTG